jgi:iron complex transport system substrate-binding protein
MKRCFVLLFLLFCACGYPNECKRIVSLGPAITEELFLLGKGDNVIGVTSYCNRPNEAGLKQKIGTITEIDVEKIASVRPDIVLATPLSDTGSISKLQKLGIRVKTFPLAKNFSDICKQFIELGEIAGEKEKAQSIVLDAEEQVKNISESVKELPKPKVFIQVGARPLFTMTKDSFVNNYIELAGGINIARENKTGLFSREEVVKQNPDVILIVSMEFAGEEEKKNWRRFGQIRAVKEDRIFVLESYKLCSPTPESFAEMLQEIKRLLHGK